MNQTGSLWSRLGYGNKTGSARTVEKETSAEPVRRIRTFLRSCPDSTENATEPRERQGTLGAFSAKTYYDVQARTYYYA